MPGGAAYCKPLIKASHVADDVIAYVPASGFCPSPWYDRILQWRCLDDNDARAPFLFTYTTMTQPRYRDIFEPHIFGQLLMNRD